ncbi:integrase [Helicobacter baculiformis]|uniref:Integrase n=1 Tax=Helicobacter baculiformis TaxID=427351 RepID=A0ABV7ZJP9_9HELI|nr:integrase [Helicobacter baculiformis]
MCYRHKIVKPNLDFKDLKQMWNANVAYSKGTKNHYFRWQEDIDYKIFDANALCESALLFYGSSGCRQLYFLLCKLATRSKSNKIALDRHYASYALQIMLRTLRLNLDILEKVGLISLVKGKKRYAYIYLKDYRELETYKSVGSNKKANMPTPFFLTLLAYYREIAKALKEVALKLKGRHGYYVLKFPRDKGRMRRFNDVILEFSPLDDPNTTVSMTYEQLTGKQIPNMKCFYQIAIVKKNLKEAFDSQMVLGEAA